MTIIMNNNNHTIYLSLQSRKELLNLNKKFDFLLELNGGHGVSKYLFVLTILEHLGTLDRNKDIDPWVKV
jgi:hypothetical protein